MQGSGSQVLHVPAGPLPRPHPAPPELPPYPEGPLTALAGMTLLAYDAPDVRDAFDEVVNSPEWHHHQVSAGAFTSAFVDLDTAPSDVRHRVGSQPRLVRVPWSGRSPTRQQVREACSSVD
ncbi:hypothetical protein OG462_40890 [Streptomyces sp. NBC_01077]|uniref:hypothetical protein n=1 Tax=Streptomyces sp. NBC_01077 TaxID=2903746 RepID=UPI003869E4F2|nr:hypothetical protein OG462_40890 [Streptomyces sp. NBC_01077]